MGIRTLSSFALKHHTTKTVPFSYLKDKRIAIDVSVFLYEWLKEAAKSKILDELAGVNKDKPEHHWEWHCIQNLDTLRKYRMRLIFLFEKSHPDEKNDTISDRKKHKQIVAKERDDLKSLVMNFKNMLNSMESNTTQFHMKQARQKAWKSMSDLLVQYTTDSVKASSETYEILRKLIKASGVQWVECDSEAEYVGVDMVRAGLVDYIMSNDSDCIACFCENYVSDFNWKDESFSLINVRALSKSIGLTPEQFQIACCCIGNDYLPCILREGIYWNSIRQEFRRLKIRTKDDMMNRFADHQERLSFCWNLYTRQSNNKTKDDLRKMIEGDGCVSPRLLATIRETGVCV